MKSIGTNDYTIKPFVTHKFNTISYVHGSTQSPVFIDESVALTGSLYSVSSSARNDSGIYKSLLPASINQIFFSTRSNASPPDYYPRHYIPSGSGYVVNVKQSSFGEGIKPGTFYMYDPISDTRLIDDGYGRVITSDTQLEIGCIFYKFGIAILNKLEMPVTSYTMLSSSFFPTFFTPTWFSTYYGNIFAASSSLSSASLNNVGAYIDSGSEITIGYASIHTIYEHQVICTANPGEFNFSVNPTVSATVLSGSISASIFTSETGSSVASEMFSGSLTPYFTTIGLYNDVFELVAVAKVPRAVHRIPTTQQTVIVRFDA